MYYGCVYTRSFPANSENNLDAEEGSRAGRTLIDSDNTRSVGKSLERREGTISRRLIRKVRETNAASG